MVNQRFFFYLVNLKPARWRLFSYKFICIILSPFKILKQEQITPVYMLLGGTALCTFWTHLRPTRATWRHPLHFLEPYLIWNHMKASSCQECMICGFLQQSEGHPTEKWRRTEGERNNFSTHPWFAREKDSLTDIGSGSMQLGTCVDKAPLMIISSFMLGWSSP